MMMESNHRGADELNFIVSIKKYKIPESPIIGNGILD